MERKNVVELIDRMRYATSTSRLVAVHDEPNHSEVLYQTKAGRYFLVYEFHAPGVAINPIKEEQVVSWMIDHQLMAALDSCFPSEVEDA